MQNEWTAKNVAIEVGLTVVVIAAIWYVPVGLDALRTKRKARKLEKQIQKEKP
jgi:hypothetical protein